jgi:hypothetical protein
MLNNTVLNLESRLDLFGDLENSDEVILYHATDVDLYNRFKDQSLKPRNTSGQDPNYSHNVEFERDKVSLGIR